MGWKDAKILDLGCADKPKPDATHVVDKVDYGFDGVEYTKHDLNEIPYPFKDYTFDKIYMDNILEHLEADSVDILREVLRILKLRGNLIITVPNVMWGFHRVCYLLGYIPHDFFLYHRKHFTKGHLYGTLMDAGFKMKPKDNKRHLLPGFLLSSITITARRGQ